MARNEILIDAPPQAVYETLLDAGAYADWVVGAQGLRGVDRSWPRKGSRFHHRVGIGPITLHDTTKIVEKKPGKQVVLEVRARPLGVGRVSLDLASRRRGKQTKVTMTERPTGGPLAWLRSPLLEAMTSMRNAIALRRLRRLVTSRTT